MATAAITMNAWSHPDIRVSLLRNEPAAPTTIPYETFDSRLYVSFPASTAAARPSFWRAIISLLRWIKSSARSRSSRALRCAYSRPSSARSLRYSRVSSPDFGAKSRPTIAPMPRPTRKKLAFDPALLSPIFSPPKVTVAQAYRGSKQSANAFRVKNLPYSRLRGTCLMQPRKYPLRLGARKLRGEILHRQFLEPCDASEFAQQFASCPLANARNFGERSAQPPAGSPLAVEGDCEPMRFVTNLLDQLQHGRVAIE